MTFKVGDVVHLKSGGPPMTVTRAGHQVETTWFSSSWHCPRTGSFDPGILEQYKGREPLYSVRPGHFPPKPFPYNPYPD